MKHIFCIIVICITLLVFGCTGFSQQVNGRSRDPQFSDYPIQAPKATGPSASIYRARDINTRKEYEERAREAAKNGPNFAGHYAIVTSSCGFICINASIVDTNTNKIFDFPFDSLSDGPCPSGFEVGGLRYRLNSQLLIVSGAINDELCATIYYIWKNNRFVQLKRVDARKGKIKK